MAIFILSLLGLVAAAWLGLWVSPVHRASFRFQLNSDSPLNVDAPLPAVTIIVPARNEGRVLGASIPSMCDQDYPEARVILIDDQSEDDSPAVIGHLRAMHPNLTVIHGSERPPGWCGKPWAVQQGVQRASTEWLLFTDADCVFHPRALAQAMRLAKLDRLDLVSVFPSLTFSSTIERIGVIGLVTVLFTMFPLGWANDPKRKMALAAGAFMLVRRSAYEKAGGHAAVRAHIIEDVNLGKNVKAAGGAVRGNFTRDLLRTEMYHSVSDMWEGLAKNAYAGMEYHPLKFWAGLIAGVIMAILPPVYLIVGAIWTWRIGSTAAWIALALSIAINVLIVTLHSRTVRFMRAPWHDVFFLPLSAALYFCIALYSMWQHHFSGGNVWKGRRYDRKMLLESVAPNEPRP